MPVHLIKMIYSNFTNNEIKNNKKKKNIFLCKSKRDKLTVLDVIADDKKLVEGYIAIVKEMSIKNKVA